MNFRVCFVVLALSVGCGDAGPTPTPSGALTSKHFQSLKQVRKKTDRFTLATLDNGVAAIQVESVLAAEPTTGKHPFGELKVSLAENSAKAGNVKCRILEPGQVAVGNGPMQWVVEISCDYEARKAKGENIRARLFENGKLVGPSERG